MVSKEEIENEGLTKDDVLDSETAEPQREVRWVPEWDEHPEERPGENTRIDDGVLYWERDGFKVAMESCETTHWSVDVSIPERVGKWFPRDIDLMSRPEPEYGFVQSVNVVDYSATTATLVLASNYQPVYEVNKWIETLVEDAEESEQFQEDLTEKLSVAAENE